MATELPILYSFRRCPYAMRARMAIVRKGFKVEHREVILRDRPAHMMQISPKGTVPVLQLPNGEVIEESLEIMQYVLDWQLSEEESIWIERNDFEFKFHLDRYKYPHRYHVKTDTDAYTCDPLEHRAVCEEILAQWNAVLVQNGPWLLGANPSFADFAILPFVRQFRIADEAWFDAVPGYDALKLWLHSFLASPLLEQAMVKYTPWQPGDTPLAFPG